MLLLLLLLLLPLPLRWSPRLARDGECAEAAAAGPAAVNARPGWEGRRLAGPAAAVEVAVAAVASSETNAAVKV